MGGVDHGGDIFVRARRFFRHAAGRGTADEDAAFGEGVHELSSLPCFESLVPAHGSTGAMKVFTIHDFDTDPREIEFIPQARQFYQSFYLAWPYWLFFCSFVDAEWSG